MTIKNKQSKGAVLITGAAKRIGREIALHLSKLEFSIAIHYNASANEAQQLAEEIIQAGGSCHLFSCALTDETATASLINDAKKVFPDLNILINNASIFKPSNLSTQGTASFDEHFSINFKAPYILTKQLSTHCKKGQIINILDTNVAKSKTRYVDYLLSKKALLDLTKIAASELAPNFRVNAIAPGLILPPENKEQAYMDRLAQNIPMRRTGSPSQIAHCVQFLLDNDYVTGQVIFNDGGEHLIKES